MKEYIERAEALDICQKEYEDRLRMADYCGDTVAWDIGGTIKGIPAADVAEVRHGRWEQHLQSSKVAPVYTCSLCKLNVSGFEKRWIKYCPYCGARMEKEDEHEAD